MHLVEVIDVRDDIVLTIVDIKALDLAMANEIDSYILTICEGESDGDLPSIKSRFIKFLSTKSKSTKFGAVAEFFIHLYLNKHGFKQEFLFFNLEEGSIKKGFDGIFTRSDAEYIVESKSGSYETSNISHKEKLIEAYSDLESYMNGNNKKSKNNPWRNAYNHASHADVNSSKDLRRKIKKLSDLYDANKFGSVGDFNIIPCSTIFVNPDVYVNFSDSLRNDYDFIKEFSGKSVQAICITKHTFDAFIYYLEH